MADEGPASVWRTRVGKQLLQPGTAAALLLAMAAVVVVTARAGMPEAGILPVFLAIVTIVQLRGQGLRDLGLRPPDNWVRTVVIALVAGTAAQVVSMLLTNPLIEHFTGTPIDLSAFEPLRGDLQTLLTLLALVWGVVVFVEEIVFRGFFVTELCRLLGRGAGARASGVVLPAILFGLAHWYQGISGMLSTGLIALLLGYLFLWAGFNLWLPILTHGFLNSVGLLLVYGNADRYLETL